jgi:Lar family restriction alleviation protein
MLELKPCPFCGGKPKVYDIYKKHVDADTRKVWKVMCGARVDCCALLNDFDTPEEAADAWNRRPKND